MNAQGAAGEGEPAARRVPWDWTDILMFIAAALVVAPVGALVLGILAQPIEGGLSDEARGAVQALAGATGVYTAWVAVVLGLVILRRHGSLGQLGWRRAGARWLALTVPVAVVTLIGAVWLAALSSHLLPNTPSGQCTQVRHEFGHAVAIAVVLVSIIDPLAEETIFRGFLYGWLRSRLPTAAAVIVSAAIFSAAHVDPLLFIPLLGVGAVLAIVYELSGSLLVSAAVHGLFNAYNIIAILTAPSC